MVSLNMSHEQKHSAPAFFANLMLLRAALLLQWLHIAAALVQLQQLPVKQFPQRSSGALRMTATQQVITVPADTGPAPLPIQSKQWQWRDYNLRYQVAGEGEAGPAMILVSSHPVLHHHRRSLYNVREPK
jgi:hypothetical protein